MNRLLFSVYLLRHEFSTAPSEMTRGLLSPLCFRGEKSLLNRKADFFNYKLLRCRGHTFLLNDLAQWEILWPLLKKHAGLKFFSSVSKQNKYISYKYKIMKISLEWIFKNKIIIMGLKKINSIENIIKYYFKGLTVKMVLKNIR